MADIVGKPWVAGFLLGNVCICTVLIGYVVLRDAMKTLNEQDYNIDRKMAESDSDY